MTDTSSPVDGESSGPVPTETGSIESEVGSSVFYAEYGDPDGTPLVFFHGSPGSHCLGGVFHDVAGDNGVRVLTFDRPGYGQSTAWPDRSLDDIGGVVRSLLSRVEVSDRVALLGFSGGGPQAVATAATLADSVERVDLVSTAVPPSLRPTTPRTQRLLESFARRTPRLLGSVVGAQARLARLLPPAFVLSQYTVDPDQFTEEQAALIEKDFFTAVGEQRSGLVTELAMTSRPWVSLLESVDAPIQLWHGERDSNVPLAGARQVTQSAGGSLTRFADEDHLSTLFRSRQPIVHAVSSTTSGG